MNRMRVRLYYKLPNENLLPNYTRATGLEGLNILLGSFA